MATKQQILDNFEYKYGVTREKLDAMIDEILVCDFWQDARGPVYRMFPYHLPDVGEWISDSSDPRHGEQEEYIWWIDGLLSDTSGFMTDLKLLWIGTKGRRRTKEEACKLAADLWCHHIFESACQDNGGGNVNLTLLGMLLKNSAQEEITPEIIRDAHKKIYDHYYYSKGMYYDMLSVDYGPCAALRDILLEAGVKDSAIDSLCPWKSHLCIDFVDNSIRCCWNYDHKETL